MRKGLATDIERALKERELICLQAQELMKEMVDSKPLLLGLTETLWEEEASALIMSSLQS